MDLFIRLVELGAPDSDVVVVAIAFLVGLLIVRLTNHKRTRERRKTRTIRRLLRELDEIEDKDGKLTDKEAKIMEMIHAAIKGDFEVDDDEEPPEDRPWWNSLMFRKH